MRDFASLLHRWLTVTARGSLFFPHDETEFPAASQTAYDLVERTERGSRVPDRAPSDALRPLNNRLNIQDHYELSIIRETLAPFAGRLSTKGRSRSAPVARSWESAQKNILAATGCTLWKWQKHKASGHGVAQWFATAASARAQT